MQDEVTQRIVATLAPTLEASERKRVRNAERTENLDAYDLAPRPPWKCEHGDCWKDREHAAAPDERRGSPRRPSPLAFRQLIVLGIVMGPDRVRGTKAKNAEQQWQRRRRQIKIDHIEG